MRTRKAAVNIMVSLLLQLVTAIAGFIFPRLFIVTYGSSMNGLISSVKQIISYFYLVEAGVADASAQALYGPLAGNDDKKVSLIVSSAAKFYFKSGRFFALMTVLLACIYPFMVQHTVPWYEVFCIVLVLGSSGIIEYCLLGKYSVLLLAAQRNYVIAIVQIIGTVLNTGVGIVLIIKGVNVLGVLLLSSLIYLSRLVVFVLYVARVYPGVKFNIPTTGGKIDKQRDAFTQQIASMIVFNSPIVILTLTSSLVNVSVYSVYNMVFTITTSFVTIFSNGLVAGFGEAMATENISIVTSAFKEFESVYYAVAVWMYSVVALMLLPFVELYTRNITDANYLRPGVAFLFILVFLVNNLRVPGLTIIYAAGKFKETKMHAVIEAVIAVTFGTVLAHYLGISGVLIGAGCAAIYRFFVINGYANRFLLNRSPWKSLATILINLVPGALLTLSMVLMFPVGPMDWAMWISDSLMFSLAMFVVIIIVNFVYDKASIISVWNRVSVLTRRS